MLQAGTERYIFTILMKLIIDVSRNHIDIHSENSTGGI